MLQHQRQAKLDLYSKNWFCYSSFKQYENTKHYTVHQQCEHRITNCRQQTWNEQPKCNQSDHCASDVCRHPSTFSTTVNCMPRFWRRWSRPVLAKAAPGVSTPPLQRHTATTFTNRPFDTAVPVMVSFSSSPMGDVLLFVLLPLYGTVKDTAWSQEHLKTFIFSRADTRRC